MLGDISRVERRARDAYFPTKAPTFAQVVTLNGLLHIIAESIKLTSGPHLPGSFDLDVLSKDCYENFCQGMESFEIMMFPCADTVQALELGVREGFLADCAVVSDIMTDLESNGAIQAHTLLESDILCCHTCDQLRLAP